MDINKNKDQSKSSYAKEQTQLLNSSVIHAIDFNRQLVQQMMQAMQEESLHFFNCRLEHTGRFIERSRDVQGLPEIVTLQHEWLMDAARDYAEMTTRLGGMLWDVSQKSVDALDEAASSITETKPKVPGGDFRKEQRPAI